MANESPVKSPCIEICVLNDADICIGCYRTAVEITDWSMLDDRRKAEVVENAARRRREDGAFL